MPCCRMNNTVCCGLLDGGWLIHVRYPGLGHTSCIDTCGFDFFLRVWLVMLIVPLFEALASATCVVVFARLADGASSRSVSPSYGLDSGTGSPGRLVVG